MPTLTFPIDPAGLVVDVRLNAGGAAMRNALAAGAVLPSIQGRALIDTGTDVTAVSPAIIRGLALPVHHRTQTQGISGIVPVQLFLMTVFILDGIRPHLPWLVAPDLVVMELPGSLPFDALIGMDVVRTCKMVVDGPGGWFGLEF